MNILDKLPFGEYRTGIDATILFRDVFVKLRLLDSLKDNPSFLTTVTLIENERPDVVAFKLYEDSSLWWTLLLVNDVVDPSDWLMGDQTLQRYVNSKYGNPYGVAQQERNGQVADIRAARIMTNKNPFGTDSSWDSSLTDPSQYHNITNQELEIRTNDSKRIIRAIRKEYMNDFLIDVEKKLRSTQ